MDAETHNQKLHQDLFAARQNRGFLVTVAGRGAKVHAAISTTRGHSGYLWPSSLCQASTPSVYHVAASDQTLEVTCQRCLAGLVKRGI